MKALGSGSDNYIGLFYLLILEVIVFSGMLLIGDKLVSQIGFKKKMLINKPPRIPER